MFHRTQNSAYMDNLIETSLLQRWQSTNKNSMVITLYKKYKRIRLKIPILRFAPDTFHELDQYLNKMHEVAHYSINRIAGNLTIHVHEERHKNKVIYNISYFLKQLQLNASKSSNGTTKDDLYDSTNTTPWHHLSLEQIYSLLNVNIECGLSSKQVREKQRVFGQNTIKTIPPKSSIEIFTNQFKNLPTGMLGGAAILSITTGGILDSLLISAVLGTNATIGYMNDSKVERTVHSLKKRNWQDLIAKRNSKKITVATNELVPGDIIYLKRGMLVPADCRIIHTTDLTVDESSLTGESKSIHKIDNQLMQKETILADRKNMIFKGSAITGGACKAIVIAIGSHTQIGIIQHLMQTTDKPQTPIQKQMDHLGNNLSAAAIGLCGLSFTIGVLRKRPALTLFKNSISLAVAAIPEGLPMVATTTLSRGVKTLQDKNLLVRNLNAVEALGNIHHLCLDKTGTITTDDMFMEKIIISNQLTAKKTNTKDIQFLLEVLVLNNEVKIVENSLEGSSTEKALIVAALKYGVDVRRVRKEYPTKEITHRTFQKRYMLTHHKVKNNKIFTTAKGNPKELIQLCSHYYENGVIHPFNEEKKHRILKINDTLSEETLRVLGVAYKNHPIHPSNKGHKFIWLGMVALKNKIKDGLNEMITSLNKAGIAVNMITGDQSNTAQAIAKVIGLNPKGRAINLVNANSLDTLVKEKKFEIILQTDVFSRVNPEHKLKIVEALQKLNRVVAMTGDGINDGPALKKADIGIAMGNKGSDVAIEVADAILLDDDLNTIIDGVKEGRNIKENIKRSVEFILATNMGEIGISVLSQIIGLPEPCNAAQYLWINLLTDIFPEIALASEPAREDILNYAPTHPGQSLINKEELADLAIDSTAMVAAGFLSFLIGLNKYGPSSQARSMAFINLTSAQMYYMLGSRFKQPLWETGLHLETNPRIAYAFLIGMGLQNIALFTPGLKNILGMGRIQFIDWLISQTLATTPLIIHEIKKQHNQIKEIQNVR